MAEMIAQVATGGVISKILGAITTPMEKAFKSIGGVMQKAFGPLGMLMRVLDALGIAEPIFAILEAFVSLLGIMFMPIVKQIIDLLLPFLPTIQGLSLALQPLITILLNFLLPLGMLNTVLPYVNQALVTLTNVLNGANWTNVQQWFNDLPSKIVGWVGDKTDNLKQWFNDLPGKISQWMDTNAPLIRDWFVNLPYQIAEWISSAGDVILAAFKKLFGL